MQQPDGTNDFIFRDSAEPHFREIFEKVKIIYRANPEHKALVVSGIKKHLNH